MKATVWMLLAVLAGVMLLAACPRKTGGEEATNAANAMNTLPPGTDVTSTPQTPPEQTTPEGTMTTSNDPNVTNVTFETTKGKFVIAVHKDWAPIGAEHFLELVKAGFYDGAPWFRVIDGFVAQCGIAADPALNEKWANAMIQDEPVVKGNLRGFVAFGKSQMPNSRSSHIFINMADNTASLDPQGFACFAEVVEGMDVIDQLARVEYGNQGELAGPGGLEKFKTQFPNADYITKVTINETAAPAAAPGEPGAAAPGAVPPAAPPAAPEGGM